ncbi:MAG: RNA-directed DNA polymerase [Geminicoccaceae bacterium]
MQRSSVGIAEIVHWDNLARAFHKAALGRRGRGDVEAFRANLERELAQLQLDLMRGSVAVGRMRLFTIRDPKLRTIHAPCFRERVLHHAIMARVGPVLDRTLVFDTYACREGKGTLAAVQRASHHARYHVWHAQIDIRAYFASIDHEVLLRLLGRKLKNSALLDLLARIVGAYEAAPGKSLPIGALTSQHLANFYLGGADRVLLETSRVAGFVRYMDDLVWWADNRAIARRALVRVRNYLADELKLEVKQPVRIARSRDGLSFCGFRILPDRILLSRRRKERYMTIRRSWEHACLEGHIGAAALQSGYASALALTVHAEAKAWRRTELARRPVDPALEEL